MKKQIVRKDKSSYLPLILLIIIFIFLLWILNLSCIKTIDSSISAKIPRLWNNLALIQIALAISFIFDFKSLVFICLIIVLFFTFRKQKNKAFFFSLVMIAGALLVQLIKFIIARPRPELSILLKNSYSFPSSHAAMSLLLFSLLIYLFKDEIKSKFAKFLLVSFSAIMIIAVGLDRIYLNAHWLSDVLAGWAVGLFVFLSSLGILKFKKNSTK